MAPELLRVDRIDEWPPASPGGRTTWIIKGETVEPSPRYVTLKTVDAWKAAILDRAKATNQTAWVTWQQDSFKHDCWLRTAEPDTTRFTYEDGKYV